MTERSEAEGVGEPTGDDTRQRLDEIVLAAAALDPPDRTSYLRQLTRNDPELVERARRLLLAASEVTESFLADPALQLLDESYPASLPPVEAVTSISPEERYVLGTMIGHGGMAEVYRAHDRQLDRPLALKLLKPGDSANLSRCLQEARAQARVLDDHVLEVYDTGELDGRPFIALRYVDGQTLSEASRDLSLEQQVVLLMQAAEGLDAAHRSGLVHRDVKPSNVLVEATEDGTLKAWVSDFGIATVGTTAEVEGVGHLVGTVAYLAPERLDPEARPDRRGDVWSFGVMMFQVFTGALPFDGAGLYEQLQAIRRSPTPSPRQEVPSLPVDLEAIVLKCLAKDPAERYATCRELAADLKRFLMGDVVEAHAAGLAYRLTRFTLRHRGWVRFAVAALLALVVSSTIAALLGWRAMRSESQALARRGQAEDLISFMLLNLRDKLDRLGRLGLIDDIGAQAMEYFAAVPPDELSDEELSRYGTALHQLGEVRMRQGDLSAAVQAFDQSLALAQRSFHRQPESSERLFELGQSHFWVGYGQRELGEYELAGTAFEAYLDISQRLVDGDETNARWRLELGYALGNLGTLLEDRGDLEAARQRFQTSLDIKRQLAEEAPEDANLQSELAWAHNSLGVVFSALGESVKARQHFEDDLDIRLQLVKTNPRDVTFQDELAVSHNYLGSWLRQHRQLLAAIDHLRRAVMIYQTLVDNDPSDVTRQLRLVINRNALGQVLWHVGERQEGLRQIDAARRWLESQEEDDRVLGLRHQELASVHRMLALQNRADGDLSGALREVDVAIDFLERRIAEVPDDRVALQRLSLMLILRGDLLEKSGEQEAAQHLWRQAAALAEPLARRTQDRSLRATWAATLLRLRHHSELRPILEELHAAEYCDPDFSELCSGCILMTERRP